MYINTGDFNTFGSIVAGDYVTFTFSVDNPDSKAALVFYNQSDLCFAFEVGLTDEYRVGQVYSVRFDKKDLVGLCYLIKEQDRLHADPYSRLVAGRDQWNDTSRRSTDYQVFSGIPFGMEDDWEDSTVKIAPCDMLMYKLHMRGFTYGASLSKNSLGNYKGLINRLAYLKKLNVTTIELMPVYDFEELFLESRMVIDKDGSRKKVTEHTGKVNYWGYTNAYYMAPKASYFGGCNEAIKAFRKLISSIHNEGMECVMEMSFVYGTSHDYIIDTLRYYVRYFHVDGFHILGASAPIDRIATDPFLGDTKIFYEHIPEDILIHQKDNKHLFLYNDSFMYVTRQIQNHMNGSMVQFANHMKRQNIAYGFVNYMSSVCGFTLWDSYSYGEKHNLANGEDNRDGNNNNFSCNYGVEGKTNNKNINAMRFLQMRNGFTAMLLSQGIPLIVAGDEVANSNDGNNNPYCQDNSMGYSMFIKSKSRELMQRFVTQLIDFRMGHKCIRQENAMEMTDYKHIGFPDLSFHGAEPWMMSIGEEQKALGVLYSGAYADEKEDVYVCYNFHYDSVTMALPLLASKKRWRQVLNTSEYNEDTDLTPKPINNQQSIVVNGSSISILVSVNIKDKT
ncbi:MAG: hypothetical protein HUJ71_06225 [Pseudobutyrivibrio sp.]|nr:hypothetical protein [Pseudobutyrivibrio sp.]